MLLAKLLAAFSSVSIAVSFPATVTGQEQQPTRPVS
jgi:hypothetical protein